MEMICPQAKRIKLEHSYAYQIEPCEFESVTIKEEDPLKTSDNSETDDADETIKIEAGEINLIKTEPVEENVEGHRFEYFDHFNVPNEIERKYIPDEVNNVNKVQSVDSESKNVIFDNPTSDPLELVRAESIELKAQAQSEKKNVAKNGTKNKIVDDIELVLLHRSQKEKDNLQSRIKKLKTELKEVKAREKALQTELGARRMSELALHEKNTELNRQLREATTKARDHLKNVKDLNHRLIEVEKEKVARSGISERERRDFTDKLERAKLQFRKKELEHKLLDIKCADLTGKQAQFEARLEKQKAQVDTVKEKLRSVERSYSDAMKETFIAKQRVADMTKELALAKRTAEDMQKSLLAEKKMSRFFIQERDQLLERQEAKFKETDRELATLKQATATLSAALATKAGECRAERRKTSLMTLTFQKKRQELKEKMAEVANKELELSKRTCEYCGF